MLTSNDKGAIAEAEIAAAAVRVGVPVLKPLTERTRYDLAFELGPRVLRVQCKWAALNPGGDVINVRVGGCRFAPQGYVCTAYGEDEIDLVAVYCADLDRCYLLPVSLVAGKRSIHLRLASPKNGQCACINLASEFQFAGAVAQLEERLNGIQEARGSSPLNSIPRPGEPIPSTIGAHEFRERFSYHLERAAGGAEVLITRHGRPLARLLPP